MGLCRFLFVHIAADEELVSLWWLGWREITDAAYLDAAEDDGRVASLSVESFAAVAQ